LGPIISPIRPVGCSAQLLVLRCKAVLRCEPVRLVSEGSKQVMAHQVARVPDRSHRDAQRYEPGTDHLVELGVEDLAEPERPRRPAHHGADEEPGDTVGTQVSPGSDMRLERSPFSNTTMTNSFTTIASTTATPATPPKMCNEWTLPVSSRSRRALPSVRNLSLRPGRRFRPSTPGQSHARPTPTRGPKRPCPGRAVRADPPRRHFVVWPVALERGRPAAAPPAWEVKCQHGKRK
jgi:hypothetical protein